MELKANISFCDDWRYNWYRKYLAFQLCILHQWWRIFFHSYIIAILVMGIPFLILENGLGFRYKESFSKLLHDINPKFEIIAWMLVLFVFIVAIYYMVILSWDLIYLMNSFTFGWGNDQSSFFATNVGGSSDFANIGSVIVPTFIAIIVLWGLLWIVSNNDVDKGIGRISKVLMPLLFVIMSFILFYSLTSLDLN